MESLEALIEDGQAANAIPLCESVIGWLADASEENSYEDNQLFDRMDRVADLHRLACEMAQPEPEQLALRLLQLERNARFNECYNSFEVYAEILGASGIATCEEAAARVWEQTVAQNHQSGCDAMLGILETLAKRSATTSIWSPRWNSISVPHRVTSGLLRSIRPR